MDNERQEGIEEAQPRMLRDVAVLLAWASAMAWPFILLSSGVASDTVQFSRPTKILLTVGSLLLPGYLSSYVKGAGVGCGITFILYAIFCAGATMVLWFWN